MFSVQIAVLNILICILVLSIDLTFCEEFSILKPEYADLDSCPTDVTQCRWQRPEEVVNCSTKPEVSNCLLCYFCPRTKGQTCGGAYHKHGHCADKLLCAHNSSKISETLLSNGVNIVGICTRKSVVDIMHCVQI